MVTALLSSEIGAEERPVRRSKFSGMTAQELNLQLRAHTSVRAMAFFDRLSPDERERVRAGGVIRGFDWQLQERDHLGRFMASASRQ